eukprot:6910163-Pyramimonas_sp.AAC.1
MKLSDHEKFDVDTCAGPITIHMPSLVVDMGKANELHQAAKRFAEKRDAYVAYEREYKGARKDKEKAPTGTTAVEVTRPVFAHELEREQQRKKQQEDSSGSAVQAAKKALTLLLLNLPLRNHCSISTIGLTP